MQDYIQEKKLLSYDDVVPFSVGDSREPLVDVRTYDNAIIYALPKRGHARNYR